MNTLERMPRRYDMLALDLDGTVLDPESKVRPAVAEAVGRARDAGMLVVVCTGRGLPEARDALDAIAQTDPVIVAGGSIIADPRSGRTLHRFPMHPTLTSRLTDRLLSRGHPVLVLKDPHAAGYDYLVVTGRRRLLLDPVTQWWFEEMAVSIRLATSVESDPHPEHTVRVGVCAHPSELGELELLIRGEFEETVTVHNFPAVVAPRDATHWAGGEVAHILECFDARADKWNAVRHLAAERSIPTARIAAIGDQINDVTMIRGCGLGIAMGNAIEAVRHGAGRVTRSNADDGVAHAISMMLAGEW
jgi:hydroxymethylpyrimidine pyrophosphatase-like HAD family hydrolase